MIQGVKIKPLVVHKDISDMPSARSKKGFLIEVLRNDDGFLKKFGQTVFTLAYCGDIKGFHWHKKQDDLWFVATGKVGIVLHDLRKKSPTHSQTDVLYAGADDYKLVLIPKGVAHGYKVLSKEPVLLFYHVTELYNSKNPDEQRIPYNDPKIGFNWDALKHET